MTFAATQNETLPINVVNARQQEALLFVQKAVMSSNADVNSVTSAVVVGALKMIPSSDGAIVELREGEDMVYRAVSGTMSSHLGMRIKMQGSLSGLCVAQGQPLFCGDTETDPRVDKNACRKVGIGSMIVVPVFHRGATIGVLKVCSAKVHAFSDTDKLMVQFFVNMIAAGFGSVAEAKALEALGESESRFERAVRGSNDGIWDWDLKAQTIYYSPRFKELLGYKEKEIGNHIEDWASLLHPDDYGRVMKTVQNHFDTRVPYYAEYRLRSKSGEYIWFEAKGNSVWNAQNVPVRMSGSLADISDKKRLQNLHKEFIYTVTHELRTPLTALKGALGIMSKVHKGAMPAQAQTMLELALRGSDRLMLLVNDLLDLDKMEAGQMVFTMETFPLAVLLQESAELMKLYSEHTISQALQGLPENVSIEVDKSRFLQVMSNLLSNAAKFSPPASGIVIGAHMQGDKVVVSVTDHGKGIPEAFKARIFDKFSQAQKGSGTGLGLNITKNMVEKMNGSIRFDSTEGEGTTFYMEFPVQQPA